MRAVAPHPKVGIVQRVDEFVEIVCTGLVGYELGRAFPNDPVVVAQDLGDDQSAGGNLFHRERSLIKLLLTEQNHDAHPQERRGIGMLLEIVLNRVPGGLDTPFVQKDIRLVEGGAFWTLRAAREQDDQDQGGETSHRE